MFRTIFLLSIGFFSTNVAAQEQNVFGRVSQKDIDLKVYAKDTTANAVVLYEKGDMKFQYFARQMYLIKTFDFKIKVLKKEGYDVANVEIPMYTYGRNTEEIYDIKGITHNGIQKDTLAEKDIYTLKNNSYWSTKRFTMPNIKPGAILQYSYKIKTPYIYDFEGWRFQSTLPKIHSEFNAKIPGHYYYNKSFYGSLKMDVQETFREDYCMKFADRPDMDCEVLKYIMKDVPAFNDQEKYMLAPSNYIARLDFELATAYWWDGKKKHFTKTWDEVDKKFETYVDVGKQLGKNHFFEKQFTENNLAGSTELETVKNIYDFVRGHFNWTKDYSIYRDVNVKTAFNKKVGNVGEINISLVNMLNAAGIKCRPMLLSTRNHGLLSKDKPAIDDFNYVIALAQLDGKEILLDATEKKTPFGMLPFRCLNHLGRVLDFEKGSYWHKIIPYAKNSITIRGFANLNPKNNAITGKIAEISQGYPAIEKHEELSKIEIVEYLDKMANTSVADLYFNNYKKNKDKSSEKVLSETYEFVIKDVLVDGKIYLDPILVKWLESSPFKSNQRNFPIDFGHPFSREYQMNIKIPKGYKIMSLPQEKSMILPGGVGSLDLGCKALGELIQFRFKLAISQSYFEVSAYDHLKEFFAEVVDNQNNTFIVLKKI